MIVSTDWQCRSYGLAATVQIPRRAVRDLTKVQNPLFSADFLAILGPGMSKAVRDTSSWTPHHPLLNPGTVSQIGEAGNASF